MLGILRLGFGSRRNHSGTRLIVITGEELTVIYLLQLHAIVVDHTVGRDCAAAALNELSCRSLTVQHLQLSNSCTASVQVHVVVTANSGEVRKIRNDCGLLTTEGQIDKILQLGKLQLVCHCLKLSSFSDIETIQPLGKIVELLHINRKHLCAFECRVKAIDFLHLAV